MDTSARELKNALEQAQDELASYRESTQQELAELKQALETARQNASDLLSKESMRQEYESLKTAFEEREKGLETADKARKVVEDQLEDAHREMDRLSGELERLKRDFGVQVVNEGGSKEKSSSLKSPQAGGATTTNTSKVGGRFTPFLVGMLFGVVLVLGTLESLSILNIFSDLYQTFIKSNLF